MYKTNIACEKAGVFEGPTVVSMRPMTPEDAIRAIKLLRAFQMYTVHQFIWVVQNK